MAVVRKAKMNGMRKGIKKTKENVITLRTMERKKKEQKS